jgi:hypothetical protein
MIMGLTGALSRGFLYGLNKMEVVGLDKFMQKLDNRKDIEGRERGLITGKGSRKSPRSENSSNVPLNSIKPCQRVCSFPIAYDSLSIGPYSLYTPAEWMIP